MRNDFYVYAWTRPDTGAVFYIGKGRRARDSQPKTHNRIFIRILDKLARLGLSPSVSRIHEWLSEADAFEMEKAEIRARGRINIGTGTLANLTDGGQGVSGRIVSDATRDKIRSAHAGRKLTERHRLKLSLAHIGKTVGPHRPETIAKMSATAKLRKPVFGRVHTDETRKLIGSYHAGKVVGDATRRKISLRNKGRKHNSGAIKNMADANRMRPPNKSNKLGLKGVSFLASEGVYRATLSISGQQRHLGRFVCAEAAARAYDKAAVDAWGVGNCYLNFPAQLPGMAAKAA